MAAAGGPTAQYKKCINEFVGFGGGNESSQAS